MIFLFFIGLSASFWLFQSLNEVYEETVSIPIQLKNVPSNAIITNDFPDHIEVKLRDQGIFLAEYIYGSRFKPIVIKFRNDKHDGYMRWLTKELLQQVSPQLKNSTQLLSFSPDTLELYYNFGRSKQLPVLFTGQISAQKDYLLSSFVISPDSVVAYANANVLDTLRYARTKPIVVRNIKDTTQLEIELEPIKGLKYEPKKVKLLAVSDRMSEKTMSVPIKGVNFPASKMLRTFPSSVNVTVQVGMSKYNTINADDFVITVNYEDLLKTPSSTYHVQLKKLPANVTRVRVSPSDVEYVIEDILVEE